MCTCFDENCNTYVLAASSVYSNFSVDWYLHKQTEKSHAELNLLLQSIALETVWHFTSSNMLP